MAVRDPITRLSLESRCDEEIFINVSMLHCPRSQSRILKLSLQNLNCFHENVINVIIIANGREYVKFKQLQATGLYPGQNRYKYKDFEWHF